VSRSLGKSIRLRSQNFAALTNLNHCEDINRAWENIKEHIKNSAKESRGLYELKPHIPWFNEECSRLLLQISRLKCSGYRIKTKAT